MAFKHNYKVFWSLFSLVVVISLLSLWNYWQSHQSTLTVKVNDQVIKVELANQPSDWYQGLSNRAKLCADCGLLFNFPDKQIREFVMRQMKFPLDIIFINDQQIIKIAANLPPEDEQAQIIYSSEQLANQVLEVNANYCQRHGIKVGDIISIIK